MRDTRNKWKQEGFRLDLRKVFSQRTVRQEHRLPREVVQFLSLEVFKTQLDKDLSNMAGTHG